MLRNIRKRAKNRPKQLKKANRVYPDELIKSEQFELLERTGQLSHLSQVIDQVGLTQKTARQNQTPVSCSMAQLETYT